MAKYVLKAKMDDDEFTLMEVMGSIKEAMEQSEDFLRNNMLDDDACDIKWEDTETGAVCECEGDTYTLIKQ